MRIRTSCIPRESATQRRKTRYMLVDFVVVTQEKKGIWLHRMLSVYVCNGSTEGVVSASWCVAWHVRLCFVVWCFVCCVELGGAACFVFVSLLSVCCLSVLCLLFFCGAVCCNWCASWTCFSYRILSRQVQLNVIKHTKYFACFITLSWTCLSQLILLLHHLLRFFLLRTS